MYLMNELKSQQSKINLSSALGTCHQVLSWEMCLAGLTKSCTLLGLHPEPHKARKACIWTKGTLICKLYCSFVLKFHFQRISLFTDYNKYIKKCHKAALFLLWASTVSHYQKQSQRALQSSLAWISQRNPTESQNLGWKRSLGSLSPTINSALPSSALMGHKGNWCPLLPAHLLF